jgi:hypothetical protein
MRFAAINCITKNAVPLHAMKVLGGGIAPTHSLPRNKLGLNGQRHAPAEL